MGVYTDSYLEYAHCTFVNTLGNELRCSEICQHALSEQATG